jgi:hypothetical protein
VKNKHKVYCELYTVFYVKSFGGMMMKKVIVAVVLVVIIILSFTTYQSNQVNNTNEKTLNELTSELKALKDLPDKYDSETAMKNGDVTNVHGKIYNNEKLNVFIEKFKKQEPAMVRVTQYTIEGDAIIKDLIYDGKSIILKDDWTRDKFAAAEDRRIVEYKLIDIIVSKIEGGTEYKAKVKNGDIMRIIWITSK